MKAPRNILHSTVTPFVCLIILLANCTDTTIEGTASTTGFKINKSSSTYTALNSGCYSSAAAKYGTNFTVTLEYTGTQKITGLSASYKFSGGTTGTTTLKANTDYLDSNSSTSSSAFRGVAGYSVTLYPCVLFGTNTSIAYTYTITTNTSQTYTTTVTINKPVGAN